MPATRRCATRPCRGSHGAEARRRSRGTRRGVKCLHAHLAWYLAGGADPVGRWTCDKLGIEPSAYRVSAEGVTEPPAAPARGPVAAIDCGTNSTRLLVVDAGGRPVVRLMRITRLGQDVDLTGRLAEEAMQRTIAVLEEFAEVMRDLGVARVRVTATSAARDAANAGEFARRVTEVLGVGPEVLAGEEEGRLAYLGATAELDPSEGPYLVIDIGGGSTELVGGGGAGLAAVSLEIGCVRVTERFLRHDPPLATELEAARSLVRGLVTGALEARPELRGASRLVGVAGTVAAFVRLDQGLIEYDRDRIHHARLTLAATERWLGELSALPVERRRAWPTLEPERADVIVGGGAVLAEAMVTLGFDELTASESDLLDGVAAELLAGDVNRLPPLPRRRRGRPGEVGGLSFSCQTCLQKQIATSRNLDERQVQRENSNVPSSGAGEASQDP